MNPRFARFLLACLALSVPAIAWGQADTGNIAGVVRDTSGAVMPGVTVEASSPALIEKVRSVVTDSQGLYRIIDLRPGTYTVTFALPGFSTVKREGIALTTGFTANVTAELRVGSLEETVTVTGESPLVDTQNVEQQQTLSREILDAIPTSRRPAQFITLIVGADGGANASNLNDVLRAQGVASAGAVRRYYGIGGGIGGPIRQNKLWFFSAARYEDRSLFQAGNYYNKRQGTVFYEPDLSQPAYNHDFSKDVSLRLTWQATSKQKLVGSFTDHPACQCTFALLEQVRPIFAPEAVAEHRYNPQYLVTGHYTNPLTGRFLIEADFSKSRYNREQRRIPGVGFDAISVTDTGLNLRYGSRGPPHQRLHHEREHEQGAVGHITAAHNLQARLDLNQFSQGQKQYDNPFLVHYLNSY